MDLNTLVSVLRGQAAAGSKIVLDSSVFADEKVREEIRAAFALASGEHLTIGVKSADIPDPSADGVLTISTATAAVLKQTNVRARLILTAPGGTIQATISFEMEGSWKFKDSFKGLDDFPFNLLETSGAHFVYSTVEQSNFVWPGERSTPSIALERGLNFLSNVTISKLPTLLKLLKPVIGETSLSLKMWGPLAHANGEELPVGKLRAPVHSDKTFDVGVKPVALTLSGPAVAVQIGRSSKDSPVQRIDLMVEADFQQTLTVSVGIPTSDGDVELIATPLPNRGSITDVIGSLPVAGQIFTDFTTHLPTELSSVFTNIALNNFALTVSSEPSVLYAGLSVGTLKPWEVMPGLKLEDLSLQIQSIEPPDGNWTRVQMAAKAEVLKDSGKFDFLIGLEKETSWKVATISGAYYGSVNLGTVVAKLIGSESSVPAALRGIQFSDFGVTVNREASGSSFSFYGRAEAAFPILDHELTSALTLVVNKTPNGDTIDLAGGLVIGEQVFSLSLKLGGANSKLEAKWENQGTPLGFGDIASAFGWDSMPPMPEGLDLALKDAAFTYDFKDQTVVFSAHSANYGQVVFASRSLNGKRVHVFSLDIPLKLEFSEAPLVGESLPIDKPVGIDNLQIIVASEKLADKDVDSINALIATPLIAKSLGKGLTLAAKLELDGPREIVLPLTGGAKKEDGQLLLAGATTPYKAEPKWFNLQKSLGPVTFEKVGVQYQDGTVRFLLNAALSAAGLTLSLDGLSVGSSLKKVEPKFDLRGLGIEYKAGDVEIGGALLKTGKDSYDGAAVIKTKQFAVSALGSYKKLETGEPSLFVYAFLDYPLGGPSFFFITGLAAGFGYNRRLIAPSIDGVAKFPLITQAMGKQKPADVMAALKSLQDYIPPNAGSIFLAVGVKFNSFKLIDSFALLTMEFGNNLSINLLGVSTAIVPTPEKTDKPVTPLAQVQIAWKATFDPDDGCLAIDARLTPNSYILSKECRLSGGFAFYSWFSGPHAGDFVQTLGGYHPDFQVPDHYPRVPRLAFDWRVSNSLTIQGNAFYALTGSALMAGGYLEVLFKEGELRAWLKVEARFLIAWKPYHYDALLSVNVGASYTFDINLLFGHVRTTISVDVGAQLHLWGPDFSGTARISLSVISFTIAFGAGASQALEPIKKWSTFQESFLPEKDVCSISVKDGLVKKLGSGSDERWVINPKEFALVLDSAVPFKFAASAADATKNLVKDSTTAFGVAPMALTSDKLKSGLTLKIKKGSDDAEREFSYSVIKKTVPRGLWGESAEPKLRQADQFIENVPAGLEIMPGKPPEPGATATIDLKVFEFSNAYYPKGGKVADGHAYAWGPDVAFVLVAKDAEARNAIKGSVESNRRRDSLLKDLGVGVKVNIRRSVADDFISAPRVGTL